MKVRACTTCLSGNWTRRTHHLYLQSINQSMHSFQSLSKIDLRIRDKYSRFKLIEKRKKERKKGKKNSIIPKYGSKLKYIIVTCPTMKVFLLLFEILAFPNNSVSCHMH